MPSEFGGSIGTGLEAPGQPLQLAQNAAIAKASLSGIGNNWTQGLANTFDPRQDQSSPIPQMDVETLLRHPKWNMLYQADPQKANIIYRNATGKTFDQALKEREEQKKFITKTVQEHIANNRIRQGVTGDWEELQDLPDTSSGALPGATKRTWGPASTQTRDLIKRAGGPEGVGLGNYSHPDLATLDRRLMEMGITDPAERKAKIQSLGLVAPRIAAPSASVLNEIKTPSNSVEGLLPYLIGKIPSNMGDTYSPHRGYDPSRDQLNAIPGMIGPAIGNIWSRIFGGELQDVNADIQTPAVTQNQLNTLRALIPRH